MSRPKIGLGSNFVVKEGTNLLGPILMVLRLLRTDTSFDEYRCSTYTPIKYRLTIKKKEVEVGSGHTNSGVFMYLVLNTVKYR